MTKLNQQLQDFARKTILEGLQQLPAEWRDKFKLMYPVGEGRTSAPVALTTAIETVVANIAEHDLNWAMTQVENSLKKLGLAATGAASHKEIKMSTTNQKQQDQGNATYNWLDRVSRCGLPDVEHAARVLKDYYEGVDSNDPRSLTQQHISQQGASQ